MMAKQFCVALLLGAGVAVAWLSGLGLCLMRGTFARLHYAGLASLVLPVVIALAIILDAGSVQTSVKAVMVAIIFMVTTPAVTHATARAMYVRELEGKNSPSRTEDEKGAPD
jgi:monovalent cation/proton antiporter MnhG/PhaG subunit